MYTDALGIGLSAALLQKDDRNKLQAIGYASSHNKAEKKYSTTHKDALAVVWSLRHFCGLIHGYPIQVKTDHPTEVKQFNAKTLTCKLVRWVLAVQDFNPHFEYLTGKANVLADAYPAKVSI